MPSRCSQGEAAEATALVDGHAARRALRADEPVGTAHLERAVAETDSSLASWSDGERYTTRNETSDLRYFG